MSYIYNAAEHYKSQMDDISDIILLNQPIMPNFVEIPDAFCRHSDLSKLNWLTSGLSAHCGEIIAGSFISGAINSNISAADVDIYFHSAEHANLWCKINNLITPGFYKNLCGKTSYKNLWLNLIIGIPFTSAETLIASFDIRACAIAYCPSNHTMIAVEGAIDDCYVKRIVLQVNARHVSVRRLIKYIKKGFEIDHHQKAMFAELLKLKPNRDQELLEMNDEY